MNIKKNAAFTLIELLVVVLIIGILTAIALPRYQLAVDKAKFMKYAPVMTGLLHAQQVYYLANTAYTMDVDALDWDLPYKSVHSDKSITLPDGAWLRLGGNWAYLEYVGAAKVQYYLRYAEAKSYCCAYPAAERYVRLCKNITGLSSCNFSKAGYDCYLLQ